jgi:hypothetical protein
MCLSPVLGKFLDVVGRRPYFGMYTIPVPLETQLVQFCLLFRFTLLKTLCALKPLSDTFIVILGSFMIIPAHAALACTTLVPRWVPILCVIVIGLSFSMVPGMPYKTTNHIETLGYFYHDIASITCIELI